MTILSLPGSPAFASSQFGLVSNTQTFISPLSGQSQSIERPGARWRADYTLPPMKRAQAAVWQALLLQLRGGAGRFYGYDPDARTPRGTALASSTSSRNEIRNGDAVGAVAGVVGSGGSAPTNWSFGPANGLTREVVGSGTEAGISYVEVRFYGTPTAAYASLSFESVSQIAVAEGESWTGSFSYRLSAGSLSNIVAVQQRLEQNQSNGTFISNAYNSVGTVDATWRRTSFTRTITDTTPDTARLRPALYLSLTIGQPIDITLRVGAVQFEKLSAASIYMPTTDTARSRSSGARIDGAVQGTAQGGTQLASWNWQPAQSALLRAGDYIAYDTSSGRSLHLLTADAASDINGRALLQVEPPLRSAPADNAQLILTPASCIMALVEDSISWQSDAQGIVKLSFAAEERF